MAFIHGPRWRRVSWAALPLFVLAGLMGTAAQAAQEACTPSTGFTNCARFTYAGADQTFAVPASVTTLNVRLWGGGGGGPNSVYFNVSSGGAGGGFSSGTLNVASLPTLAIRVGQGGVTASGTSTYGGGGSGGATGAKPGGSGGGYSGIFSGSTAIVIAGGGGGGAQGADTGAPTAGAGGGTSGNSSSAVAYGGRGGTQAAGGAGAPGTTSGAGLCTTQAQAGSSLQGGNGGITGGVGENGGGGGGGYFGGGGGRCQGEISGTTPNGPGGGGSSYIAHANLSGAGTTAGTNGSFNSVGGAAAQTAHDQYTTGIGNGVGAGGPGTAAGHGQVVIQWVSPRVQITKTTLAGTTGSNSFSFAHAGLQTLAGVATGSSTLSVTAAGSSTGVLYVGPLQVAQTITETPPTGFRTNSIQCVDANAAANGNTNPVASSTTVGVSSITIPAAAMRAGLTPAASAAITCTFSNQQMPSVAKAFAPATFVSGGSSVLTLTLTNPNATAATLSSALVDTLPAGVTLANQTFGGTCPGTASGTAGGNTLTYPSGATIPGGSPGSCTVTANVTSLTPGAVTNTIGVGDLQTSNGSNATAATASLTVTAAAPTLAKAFAPSAISAGGTSVLTITLSNPNTTAATLSAALVDTLPTGMTLAPTPNASTTCTGSGLTASAGASSITLPATRSLPGGAPGSCTVSVNVTSSTVGTLTNTLAAGTLQTSNGNNAAAATANLTVTPVVTTLQFTKALSANRVVGSDQFVVAIRTGGVSGTVVNSTANATTLGSGASVTAGSGTTGSYAATAGTAYTLTEAAAGGANLANYSGALSCVDTAGIQTTGLPAGEPFNPATGRAVTPVAGAALSCTLTNTPILSLVAGNVYNDANHNGSLEAGEAGIGGASAWYVKLTPRTGGACTGPATAFATVNLSSGAYSLPSVAQGNYCLILDGNNTLSDIAPGYPSGWIGTQNPTGVIQLVVGGAPPAPQNFGLYNGSNLSGNVFADNGAGGGTANNGIKAGSEAGLASITVNAQQGASTVASTSSASDGSYTLWLPAATSGTVTLTPALPAGYTATGGSAGNTGGSYSRPSVSYTAAAGYLYSGVNFGMVAPNTLAPNGAQTAQPGTPVFYAHTYTAATGGQVTFTLTNTATPTSPAWSQVLYQDSNCNATLEASEPILSAALTVTAGQTVCLIVKQFVPAGASVGAQNSVTLSAAFSYSNASPALAVSTLSVIDITTVGQAGDLSLGKLVSNVTQAIAAATSVSANPGDTLQYTLTATNNGTQALSTLFVNDSTTAFTGFVSAACPGSLPAGITACVVTTQPAVGAQGALKWTFTGSLASGAQLVVSYRVKVDE